MACFQQSLEIVLLSGPGLHFEVSAKLIDPVRWVLVPDFPLTSSGKVQKLAVRENHLAGNYGEVLNGSQD